MEYNFREIERKWQQRWNESNAYKVDNNSTKPKYYVLDMFPYPSGAGLHVGHPLGYIASDIYSRYKRLKGFNVLHPMGYDAFGLPAEQYAIEHGIHPAESTAQNIANFRRQLDNIGFSYDWSREVKTSDPGYYKWTQWIFLQLFKSWYNRKTAKAESINGLIDLFTTEGNAHTPCPGDETVSFTAEEWNNFDEKQQQDILMQYRLAYCGEGEVNWCEALGTVLANDEVVNGVSERGGYPVVKKKLRQWYLRITEYAGRLQADLDKLEWTDAMKEMQTNWIGKSYGAEIEFEIATPHPQPLSSRRGEPVSDKPLDSLSSDELSGHFFQTAENKSWQVLKEYGRENRKNQTGVETILWEELRNNKLGQKVRRQHNINGYIADFAFMESHLVIELDGGYHNQEEQKTYDAARTRLLEESGFTVIRFTNEEVLTDLKNTLQTIKTSLSFKTTQQKDSALSQTNQQNYTETNQSATNSEETKVLSQEIQQIPTEAPLSVRRGAGGEAALTVYTTRPDTIMGVDFMVVAPELEWINDIKSPEQATAVDEYIAYVNSRSERERQAEKKITGCFTGAYAINPFNGREIPIWISEYVLAGYGTGAIMAVPCGDDRDFKFAKHFNIPITNIIGDAFNGEEANPTKDAVLSNSGFLDGMLMRQAAEIVMNQLEEQGIGRRKTNYRMRDAAFSRQRYWGEPFPIVWKDGIAYPLPENELPLELPYMENIKPGSNGEGPLANNLEWALTPGPSPQVERGDVESDDIKESIGAANVPKYDVADTVLYENAKRIRKEFTNAEEELWQLLRGSQLGAKFRRQHPIDRYIVDFAALQNKLIIEIDGGYHEDQTQQEYDIVRTKVLNDIGFTVVRFTNEEVLKDAYAVKKKISNIIQNSNSIVDQTNTATINLSDGTEAPLSTRGEGPGVRAIRETNTMPGYAGSSWYFLRYMDPHNTETFADRKVTDYWNQVDVYIGGTEHAVGHLLYSRMWTKALFDLGHIGFDEPFKKLVNQGMIQGKSYWLNYIVSKNEFGDALPVYKAHISDENVEKRKEEFLTKGQAVNQGTNRLFDAHRFVDERNRVYKEDWDKLIDVNPEFVSRGQLVNFPIEWEHDKSSDRDFITLKMEFEKMSKSKRNVDNPDDITEKYGADTFRMYEMFLGPIEQSKPWDTKGIEGVHRFLKKLWRLFFSENGSPLHLWKGAGGEEKPTDAELKILHRTIKKIEDDTERFSFNTAVSAFMVCVNDLGDIKCYKKAILEPLLIMLTPYAPHIAEELYQQLQGSNATVLSSSPVGGGWEGASVLDATFPAFEEKYIVESTKEYPVSINGKLRTTLTFPLDAEQSFIEKEVMANDIVIKWTEGKEPRKIIYVKGRMINVVV